MSTGPITVVCPYCGGDAVFMETSGHVYRHDYGPIFDCRPCDAYVGAHPNGEPKGTPAKKVLRELRKACHKSFDVLWQEDSPEGRMTRSSAYGWLSNVMGVPRRQAHIGMFNEEQCKFLLRKLCERRGEPYEGT